MVSLSKSYSYYESSSTVEEDRPIEITNNDTSTVTYMKWNKWKIKDGKLTFAIYSTMTGVFGSILFGLGLGLLNATQDWIGEELWPCESVPYPPSEEAWTMPDSWSKMVVSQDCWDVMSNNPTLDVATLCNSGIDDKDPLCGDCISPSVKDCNQWSWWMSILACSVLIGAAVSTGMGGILGQWSIHSQNYIAMIILIVGTVCTICSGSIASIVIARIITGFGVGMVSTYPPVWIATMTPINLKGAFGAMHQFFITIGVLIGPLLGLGFGSGPFLTKFTFTEIDSTPDTFSMVYWRCVVGIGYLIPIFVNIFLYSWMDMDTPMEYLNKGRHADAKECVKRIYMKEKFEDVKHYYDDIVEAVEDGIRAKASGLTFRKACSNKEYRWMIFVGCACAAIQQLSGVNILITASNQLFAQAGVKPSLITIMSVVMTVILTSFTFPAVYLIEKLGRKSLLVYGIVGQCIGSLLPVIGGWAAPNEEWGMIMMVTGVMIFIASFSIAMGPVLWVWFTEIFPTDVNLASYSFLLSTNWVFGIIMVFIGVAITDNAVLFTLLLCLNILSLIFVMTCARETKGLPSGVSPFLISKEEAKEYIRESARRKAELKSNR